MAHAIYGGDFYRQIEKDIVSGCVTLLILSCPHEQHQILVSAGQPVFVVSAVRLSLPIGEPT